MTDDLRALQEELDGFDFFIICVVSRHAGDGQKESQITFRNEENNFVEIPESLARKQIDAARKVALKIEDLTGNEATFTSYPFVRSVLEHLNTIEKDLDTADLQNKLADLQNKLSAFLSEKLPGWDYLDKDHLTFDIDKSTGKIHLSHLYYPETGKTLKQTAITTDQIRLCLQEAKSITDQITSLEVTPEASHTHSFESFEENMHLIIETIESKEKELEESGFTPEILKEISTLELYTRYAYLICIHKDGNYCGLEIPQPRLNLKLREDEAQWVNDFCKNLNGIIGSKYFTSLYSPALEGLFHSIGAYTKGNSTEINMEFAKAIQNTNDFSKITNFPGMQEVLPELHAEMVRQQEPKPELKPVTHEHDGGH